MPPRKNPLEDARNRLKEKLGSIQEQSDYITQFVGDYVKKAAGPAKDLLKENNRKKFFHKYSAVNQELEKCLDCLLLVSDSLSALEEKQLLEGGIEDTSSTSESDNDVSHTSKTKNAAGVKKDGDKKEAPQTDSTQVADEKPVSGSTEGKASKREGEKTKKLLNESPQDELPARNDKSPVQKLVTRENQGDGKISDRPPALQKQTEKYKEADGFKVATPDLNEERPPLKKESCLGRPLSGSAVQQKETLGSKTEHEKFKAQRMNQKQKNTCSDRSSPGLKIQKSKSKDKKNAVRKGSKSSSSPESTQAARTTGETLDSASSNKEQAVSMETRLVRRGSATVLEANQYKPIHVVQPYPFTNGSCLEVVVTEVLSPWELWIEPCGSAELDLLLEQMCMHYAKVAGTGYKGGLKEAPRKGGFYCGKLTHDDTWYRVLVTEVYPAQEEAYHKAGSGRSRTISSSSTASVDEFPPIQVDVLCVDDGTRERLPLSRLRVLEEQFAQLPCQALCCALAGVQPIVNVLSGQANQVSSLWSNESIEWLKRKVSGQKLLAYPTRTGVGVNLVIVDLYQLPCKTKGMKTDAASINSDNAGQSNELRPTLPGLQFSIAEMMIKAGVAQRIGQPNQAVQQTDSRSSSPRSVKSEESLPRSCSTVSIASSGPEGAMPSVQEGIVSSVQDGGVSGVQEGIVSNVPDGIAASVQKGITSSVQEEIVSSVQDGREPGVQEGLMSSVQDSIVSSVQVERVSSVQEEIMPTVCKDQIPSFQDKDVSSSKEAPEPDHDIETLTVGQQNIDSCATDKAVFSPLEEAESSIQKCDVQVDQDLQGDDFLREDVYSIADSDSGVSGSVRSPKDEMRDILGSSNDSSAEHPQKVLSPMAEDVPVLPQPLFQGCVHMMMAHIVDPSKFYVHLVSPEAAQLDNMMNELNKFYNGNLLPDDEDEVSQLLTSNPKVGDFCCARFSSDQQWYRAQVQSITTTKHVKEADVRPDGSSEETPEVLSETQVEVFYIDFGDMEWVSSSEIRLLLPRFMKLPGQVVRCSLANIEPYVEHSFEAVETGKDEKVTEVQVAALSSKESDSSEIKSSSNFTKKGKKKKAKSAVIQEIVDVAAGDESYDSEEMEMESLSRKFRNFTPGPQESKIEEISEEIFSLVESPVKQKTSNVDKQWSQEAVELFKGLTDEDKQLVGYTVNQDPQILHQVFNPIPEGSSVMGINCRRPSLKLNLYDTTGEEDIFINQVLVDIGYATFCKDRLGSGSSVEGCATKVLSLTVNDLQETAENMSSQGTEILLSPGRQDLPDPTLPMSPTSPTTQMMNDWDPMATDYFSTRNDYNLDTDDTEVAIQGYKHPETRVCHFYKNKSGCWRGENCPNLHVLKEPLRKAVSAYYQGQCQRSLDLRLHNLLHRHRPMDLHSSHPSLARGSLPRYHPRPATPPLMSEPFVLPLGKQRLAEVPDGADLGDVMEAFCDNIDSGVELPDVGTWVAIKITAVFNPGHFWAQLPYGTEPLEKLIIEAKSGRAVKRADYKEDLESLMSSMGQQYARGALRHRGTIPLAIGELVVAQYSKDGLWYRARVTDLREDELQVFFVDYGNSEWTAEDSIGRMLPHFLHLPFQALECFLGNVEPSDDEKGWSRDAKEYFEDITADKILVAHVLSRAWNQTLYLDLYDTSGGTDVHINKDIINKAHAKEPKFKVEHPWNIEAMHNLNPKQVITLPG